MPDIINELKFLKKREKSGSFLTKKRGLKKKSEANGKLNFHEYNGSGKKKAKKRVNHRFVQTSLSGNWKFNKQKKKGRKKTQ